MVLHIRKENINEWLRNSQFYREQEHESEIVVPQKYYTENPLYSNNTEVVITLHVCDFWNVDKIPDELIEYLYSRRDFPKLDIYPELFESIYSMQYSTEKEIAKQLNYLNYTGNYKFLTGKDLIQIAVYRPDFNLLDYFINRGFKVTSKVSQALCLNLDLDILRKAINRNFPFDEHCLNICSQDYSCFVFVLEHTSVKLTESNIIFVASEGKIDILNYLIKNYRNLIPRNITKNVAFRGQLEILKFLVKKGFEVNEETCKYSEINCLKYLREKLNCPWDETATYNAAALGYLEKLIYCHENNCPWNSMTCNYAIMKNKLQCLKYCVENLCPITPESFYFCVKYDSLSCFKFLYPLDIDLEYNVLLYIIELDRVEFLKFLHELGMELNSSMFAFALDKRSINCLEYLYKNDCPRNDGKEGEERWNLDDESVSSAEEEDLENTEMDTN